MPGFEWLAEPVHMVPRMWKWMEWRGWGKSVSDNDLRHFSCLAGWNCMDGRTPTPTISSRATPILTVSGPPTKVRGPGAVVV